MLMIARRIVGTPYKNICEQKFCIPVGGTDLYDYVREGTLQLAQAVVLIWAVDVDPQTALRWNDSDRLQNRSVAQRAEQACNVPPA